MKKNETNFPKIENSLKSKLDSKRFKHTLGVVRTAAALAERYNFDTQKAQLAGLLHDCAKCIKHDEKIAICLNNGIEMTAIEKRNPFLLHSKVGCFIAKTEYGVRDEDVLNAILNHTTGRPQMSVLEKIIFIADYIEPGRDEAPHLKELRKMAYENLDKTLLFILKDTLEYLDSRDGEIDPTTQSTYNYYKERIET